MVVIFTSVYIGNVLFRGYLSDEDDERDFGEIDSDAHFAQSELNLIRPHKNPSLALDYLGISGEVELIYRFKVTWDERESDIQDYLDEVQESIENLLFIIISEREFLGYSNP